jgi:hypothetical protein
LRKKVKTLESYARNLLAFQKKSKLNQAQFSGNLAFPRPVLHFISIKTLNIIPKKKGKKHQNQIKTE